ncbi:MAG: SMP-30/gluconolactonase/LRE family protein [Geminicoccaceae bacterium]
MRKVLLGLLLTVAVAGAAAAADSWTVVNPKSFYPEGPLWHDGKLWYVEYSGHTVMTWDGKENRQVWKQDGCGPAALGVYGDGLLVTCYDANTLVVIGTDGSTKETIAKDAAGNAFLGPNDLAEDGKGGLYLSMSGVYDTAAPIQGMVYHLDASGALKPVADTIHYSNGMGLTDGGKTLLVSEMLAQRVLAFEVKPDGTLGQRKVFLRLQDIVPDPEGADAYYGPDGLKVGKDGRVYIAQNGGASILIVDPTGKKLLHQLPVGGKYVTNVALSPDEKRVFVTATQDAWNAPYPGEVDEVANP